MNQSRTLGTSFANPQTIRALRLFVIILASFIAPLQASAQYIGHGVSEEGNLPTTNFGTRDYRAHSQNWAIAQAPNGLIYVANGNGVLEFDGVSWRLIYTDVPAAVRSLAVGHDGRVYVGGSGELGFLDADSTYSTAYFSLTDHIDPQDRGFMEVWRVVPTAEGVYFSSRERLFRWDNESLKSWTPETSFALGFVFDDAFHVVEPGRGLMRMEDDVLIPSPVSDAFVNDIVYEALPDDDDVILITRDNGLQRFDGLNIEPFSTEVDAELKRGRVYHGAALRDGRFAIATRASGVFIINRDGRLERVLNEASGMADSQTWFAFEDAQRGLWVALNRGIARVDFSAEYTYFDESAGVDGLVAAVNRHQDQIHVATSTGVLRLDAGKRQFKSVIGGEAGQCFSLQSLPPSLLVACEGGVYDVRDEGIRHVNVQNTRMLYPSRRDSNVVYAGSRDGLFRIVRERDDWFTEGPIEGLPPWALSMYEEDDGRLWVTTVSDGVYLSTPADGANDVTHFGAAKELWGGWVYVSPIAGRLMFHSQKGILSYTGDAETPFTRDTVFIDALEYPEGEVFLLTEDDEGSIWLSNQTYAGRIRYDAASKTYLPMDAFRQLPESGLFHVYADAPGNAVWIGTEGGVLRIDRTTEAEPRRESSVVIRRVAHVNGDSLLFGGYGSLDRPITVGPDDRSLRISYSLPVFSNIEKNSYQVRLEGQDRGWSAWTSETSKDYTNLRPGRYTFRVRGRDVHGNVSREASIQIHVLASWYQAAWARTLWATFGVLAIWGVAIRVNKFRIERLQNRNAMLEEEVRERTLTLKNANERLQHVLAQNNEFVSIAAHDLKNPLAGILGLVNILLEDDLDERDQTEFIGMIRTSALGMTEIVEQLQDVETLDQGALRLAKRHTNLVPLCEQVIQRNELQADRKKISLFMESSSDVYANVDEQYFPRIVDNLLSNAIKFSPSYRRVWIRIERVENEARVSIRDEGPGLTPADRQNIFGKLQRLSAKPTAGEKSTGLGLYIVRTLVDLHGGTIDIESEEGKGTCFTVVLPASDELPSGDGASREVSLPVADLR